MDLACKDNAGFVLGLALAVPLLLGVAGCRDRSPATSPPPAESGAGKAGSRLRLDPNPKATVARSHGSARRVPLFVDIHSQAGIDFTFDNSQDGRALMVTSTAAGGGWLDYDNDGHWDLWLAQGGDAAPPRDRERDRPSGSPVPQPGRRDI